MDWIFDNFQFVFAFIAAFLWWLNKRREAPPPEEGEAPPVMMDEAEFEDAERARRIQEEIRRKIMERQGRAPVEAPPQVLRPEFIEAQPRVAEAFVDPNAAILEHQRRMEQQLREIEQSRRQTAKLRTLGPERKRQAAKTLSPVHGARGDLIRDLRGAKNLRRAIVLREVLGSPKGLQN